MADMLGNAAAWLDGRRKTSLARTVLYVRGGESVSIAATPGRTTYEVADEAGATVEAVATDFIVSAADLILGGTLITPEIGDRIHAATSGGTLVYEVLVLGAAGHFRRADPAGVMLRIHARQIGIE